MFRIIEQDLQLIDNPVNGESDLSCVQHISYCKFIKLNEGVCLLGLKHPSTIYFRGILEVICLKGEAEILGHITKCGKSVDVFSFLGSSAIYISTVNNSSSQEAISGISWPFDVLNERVNKKIGKLIETIGNEGTILLLTSKIKKYGHWKTIFNNKKIRLFPDYKLSKGVSYFKEAEETLDCIFDHFNGTRIDRKISIDNSWNSYVNCLASPNVANRLMICGGKGFGKSTLLRYLVNRTLLIVPKVIVIDCDIGQSELNISSCISCHVVSKPLLGPNFSHLQQPKWSICLGTVNATHCVNDYIIAVENLINKCNSDSSIKGLPWLVNTMGFSRGIGLIMTTATVRIVRPTTLLVLYSEEQYLIKYNYSQSLISENISAETLYPYKIPQEQNICNEVNIISPVDSVCNKPFHFSNEFSSKKFREAAELVYFTQHCYIVTLRLQSLEQRCVELENCRTGEILPLCNNDEFKNCVGFGKVIFVDTTKAEITISTPVNVEDIFKGSDITILSLGKRPFEIERPINQINPAVGMFNNYISWRSKTKFTDSRRARSYIMLTVCPD